MSQSKTCKRKIIQIAREPIQLQYKVRMWGEDYDIDCNSIIQVAEWARRFTTNRLDNDVSTCVHRCVIGTYQLGYLYNYMKIKEHWARQSYLEEGIASALFHFIASYEMIGRRIEKLFSINNLCWDKMPFYLRYDELAGLDQLAEFVYKYQRWMLYWDMGRKKRWDEKAIQFEFKNIILLLVNFARNQGCNLARGFQACMQKLLDQEIKNH